MAPQVAPRTSPPALASGKASGGAATGCGASTAGVAGGSHPVAPEARSALADKTVRLLRESFQQMAGFGFEVEVNMDQALDAFELLRQAAAHMQHHMRSERARRMRQPVMDGSNTGNAILSEGERKEEKDYLKDVLDGIPWNPDQVLRFLFQLHRKRRPLIRQVLQAALDLVQISAVICEHVRSEPLLECWLCTRSRGIGRDKEGTKVVSYELAAALKLATRAAAAHWAKVVQEANGKELNATWEDWKRQEKQLLESKEFEWGVLQKLCKAVECSARHCMLWRFPQRESRRLLGERGLFKNFSRYVVGGRDSSPYKDEFYECFSKLQELQVFKEDLQGDLQWMIWNLAWSCANRERGYKKQAGESLVRSERHFQRAIRGENQWRGVTLGGWLAPRQCRQANLQREDLADMKAAGLSYVRLPFDAWCVDSLQCGERSELDRALDLLEGEGLRVLLDLHMELFVDRSYGHEEFNQPAALRTLQKVARRYAGRHCVCGLAVGHEPAAVLEARQLAKYYEQAIDAIREAGMAAGEVVVVLPIRAERHNRELLDSWEKNFQMYEDCTFDVRWDGHCSGALGLGGRYSDESLLRLAKDRAELLKNLPACLVGEWSLRLPDQVIERQEEDELSTLTERFAAAQLEAYEHATHGWFFWAWKDAAGAARGMSECLERGLVQVPGVATAITMSIP